MHCRFKCTQRIISGVYLRPPQTNWPGFKSMRRKWREKIENATNRLDAYTLTKHSPGNNNSDDDDDAKSITRTNRKKAFRPELIGKITADWVCFSCFCPRLFFFCTAPCFACLNQFLPLAFVCVYQMPVHWKSKIEKKYLSFCTTSFLFSCAYFRFHFYFFVICCCCAPFRSSALFSVFNCRLLCSLQGTLFRSGFVSIDFLWTAKKGKNVTRLFNIVFALSRLYSHFLCSFSENKKKNIWEPWLWHEKNQCPS